jgi:hypothetical protein
MRIQITWTGESRGISVTARPRIFLDIFAGRAVVFITICRLKIHLHHSRHVFQS